MMRSACLLLLVLVLGIAAVGAMIPPDLATATDPGLRDAGMSWSQVLGTDRHGRSLFIRLMVGLANDVTPAVLACALAGVCGVVLGVASGWRPGVVDRAVQLIIGVIGTVPRYVLVLLVLTVWGDRSLYLALAAGIAWTPPVVEAVCAQVRRMVSRQYILASRVHGVPLWRLVVVHAVWHGCRRTIARQLLGLFAAFLVLEASLAYIGGLGIREPNPSIGNLIAMQWTPGAWTDLRFWVPVAVLVGTIAAARGLAHTLTEPDGV